MSWFDIVKNTRRGKRKVKPYSPFTGKGLKVSEIADRKKVRHEERIKTAEEKPNKLPIGRVHNKFGGNSSFSRMYRINNPKNRCAKCGRTLTANQQTLTRNNASGIKYCNACAKSIEEKNSEE